MLDDWRTARVQVLRSLLLRAEPAMVEEVKWRKASNPDGVPTFSCDGLVCTLETYRDKVKATFARGAAIADPDGLFNASLDAGTRRAIDLREDDPLDEDAFVALVRAAVAHNRECGAGVCEPGRRRTRTPSSGCSTSPRSCDEPDVASCARDARAPSRHHQCDPVDPRGRRVPRPASPRRGRRRPGTPAGHTRAPSCVNLS